MYGLLLLLSNVTSWKLVSAALLKIFFRKRHKFSKGTREREREREHVMIARKKTVVCCMPKWP